MGTNSTITDETSDKAAYVEFVNSLFAGPRNLFVGMSLQIGIMLMYIHETGFLWLSPFILAAFAAALWRYSIGKQYWEIAAKRSADNLDEKVKIAGRWERKYLIPSTFMAANIGFFSFFAIEYASSKFGLSAALCLLFSPLPTIVGRMYGSRRLASFMLFGQFAPVIIGYLTYDDIPHAILAFLCVPYIALVLGMVDNVRATVIRAVRGNAEKIELGRQFDVALSNMSHGLIMFDRDNRILIINDQAIDMFNLPPRRSFVGRPLDVVLRYVRRFQTASENEIVSLQNAMKSLLGQNNDRKQIMFDDGRYLELNVSERAADGGVVITFEDITERVLTAQKIEHMAQFDGLTKLSNRQHFENLVSIQLQRDIERDANGYCALVVVDVDDFKHVNDAVGHAQGDALLCNVAQLLQSRESETQLSCRLGGDEFLIFISGLKTTLDAEERVRDLSSLVSGSYELRGEQIHASCSIGYYACHMDAFVLDKAINNADLALYAAKKDRKGSWCQFEQTMDDEYHRRQKLKQQLIRAIEEGDLSMVYQPLVDARSGRLVSCEALSRWYDEEFGHVSPAEYIPLAEEMGIVSQISAQVLNHATQACAKWPDHLSVSVNLSPVDFRTGDILGLIEAALHRSGLSADRLEIEITETAVISNEKDMIEKLKAIHQLGVRIALDDFGTGQSSLSYLHRLPLDKVKIDRSFVVGIDTGETPIALLRGVTDLCRILKLDVTVEGVETQAQLRLVVDEAKVDRVQGYIYGAGLPASGIDVLAQINKMPLYGNAEAAG